jgi:hypothetical protein
MVNTSGSGKGHPDLPLIEREPEGVEFPLPLSKGEPEQVVAASPLARGSSLNPGEKEVTTPVSLSRPIRERSDRNGRIEGQEQETDDPSIHRLKPVTQGLRCHFRATTLSPRLIHSPPDSTVILPRQEPEGEADSIPRPDERRLG